MRQSLALFAEELGVPTRVLCVSLRALRFVFLEAISALKERGRNVLRLNWAARRRTAQSISRIVIHPQKMILQSFRRKLYGGYDWSR